MNVLNISTDDYANFAHDNARSLRSIGVNCIDVKTHPHIYSYETESSVFSLEKIKEMAASVDLIQIFHSDERILNAVKHLKKRIVVYHTGTRYRLNPQHFNRVFNPHVERSFIALGEFAGLGSKNETYIVGAVDVPESIDKTFHQLSVAHYPSNPKVKGTSKIIQMMEQVGTCNFKVDTSSVTHKNQLQRMMACDIYIELFNPSQGSKKYGSFGITALEAAAMGKIVVTQNLSSDVYAKNYGACPLILCETESDFIEKMNSLLKLSPDEIQNIKDTTHSWMQARHSFKSTGRLLDLIFRL